MDFLKKFWPLSFKNNDSVANLVIGVIIYVVINSIAGVLLPVVANFLPLMLAWPFKIVGTLIGIYATAGIVLKFLAYFNVLK